VFIVQNGNARNIAIAVTGNNNIQYRSVGFETPVSLRQHEKVVIGTTTMGHKALIVVVTANVDQ
jgi:hypothetical protein